MADRRYLRIEITTLSDEGFMAVREEMKFPSQILRVSARKHGSGWTITLEAYFTDEELRDFSLDFQLFGDMDLLAKDFGGSLGQRNLSAKDR